MRKKLTDTVVHKTSPPEDDRLELLDTITPGFGLRITPAGSRTFFVIYRIKPIPGAERRADDRKQYRLTLGDATTVSLADARKQAQDALAMAQAGKDPKIRKAAVVAEHKAEDAATVAQLFESVARDYVSKHAKVKLKEWRAVELHVENRLIPEWRGRPIQSIRKADIIGLLETIGARTPVQANRMFALLSRFFGWCVERDILEHSPMAGLKKLYAETSRDRVLTEGEIRDVWLACDTVGYPGGTLAKLLLLTACRLREISDLTDDMIGEDVIALPETKNGRAHLIPITKQIRAVLRTMPRFKGDYILTSTAGKRPMQNFADVKAKLDEASGVAGWTFHDLRRTAASSMARLKIQPHIIEAVLNHKSGAVSGVAAVYNRYSYLDEKRDALEKWGRDVDRIVAGKPALTVVKRRA